MTANLGRPRGPRNRPATPVLLIGCDNTWQRRLLPAASGNRLVELLGGPAELIPLTPRACLCVTDNAVDQHQPVNPLASALLGFLQLPIVQVLGTACVTGYSGGGPTGLTDLQQRGFTRTLTTLLAMPDYLALHAQACRVSASWARPQGVTS